MKMLEIGDLSVKYGYITALRNVNIDVHKGELVTLIGSNGAGKTSLLMAVSNLIGKSSGQVIFNDEDITHKAPDRIARMGISHVPEGRKIFPALTVYENLVAGTTGKPQMTREEFERLLSEVFTLFPRLKERTKQYGGSLSGGEQQMLAIARGLMMDPKLMLLDEPSLGLAPILVEELFELIQNIRSNGKTILLIEQNAAMALSIADRGYVLETGKVVMQGKGLDLLKNPEVRKVYLGG